MFQDASARQKKQQEALVSQERVHESNVRISAEDQ